MSDLNIKPTHKPIKTYYAELEKYAQLGEENEGTVRAAFQNLLQHYCHQSDFTLLCKKTRSLRSDNEDSVQTALNRRVRHDGEVVDAFGLPHGYWEAKDTQTEAEKPRPRATDLLCVSGGEHLGMAGGSLRIQRDGAGTR